MNKDLIRYLNHDKKVVKKAWRRLKLLKSLSSIFKRRKKYGAFRLPKGCNKKA